MKQHRKGLAKAISFILVLSLVLAPATWVFGADAKSKSVKLNSTTGTVAVKKGTKNIKITEDMRVLSGYSIVTSADSYAFLELDDSKFAKVDQNSRVKIKKKNKTNELQVASGSIFFNVTKPLKKDESVKLKTSNITMSVRGTTGTVGSVPVYDSSGAVVGMVVNAQIYTGVGYVDWANEKTGETGQTEIKPNTQLEIKVDAKSGAQIVETKAMASDGSDIPPSALEELIKAPEVLKQVEKNLGVGAEKLKETLQESKAREEAQIKEIVKIVEDAVKNFETNTPNQVITTEKADTKEVASEPEKPPSGGGSGGGAGVTPPESSKDTIASVKQFFHFVKANTVSGATKVAITITGNVTIPAKATEALNPYTLYNVEINIAPGGVFDTSAVAFQLEGASFIDNQGTVTLGESSVSELRSNGGVVVATDAKADMEVCIFTGGGFKNEGEVESPVNIEGNVRMENSGTLKQIVSGGTDSAITEFIIVNSGTIEEIEHNKGLLNIENSGQLVKEISCSAPDNLPTLKFTGTSPGAINSDINFASYYGQNYASAQEIHMGEVYTFRDNLWRLAAPSGINVGDISQDIGHEKKISGSAIAAAFAQHNTVTLLSGAGIWTGSLDSPLTVPEGKTLVLRNGTLIAPVGAALTNRGTVKVGEAGDTTGSALSEAGDNVQDSGNIENLGIIDVVKGSLRLMSVESEVASLGGIVNLSSFADNGSGGQLIICGEPEGASLVGNISGELTNQGKIVFGPHIASVKPRNLNLLPGAVFVNGGTIETGGEGSYNIVVSPGVQLTNIGGRTISKLIITGDTAGDTTGTSINNWGSITTIAGIEGATMKLGQIGEISNFADFIDENALPYTSAGQIEPLKVYTWTIVNESGKWKQ